MKPRPISFLVVSVASLLLAPSCKNDEACGKARNAASDAWKAVTETAGKNKVAPSMGIEELPPDKKAPHVEAWTTIEKQADMISSSFAYEKITWNTSDPAQQKANDAFAAYFAKDKYKTFDIQLRDANDKYKAVASACRE